MSRRMFTNGTSQLDFNNDGQSRWHQADTTQTLNQEYTPNDSYNNSDCKFHVPFAEGHVSTTLVMFDYNLVQPTDDLLHSELLSLQATDIMGKEFISVTDAEEFYKKYSYCMRFSMRKDRVSRDTHGLIKIRRWVQSLRSVGMKTSQVMDHLVDQAGSYAGVGHTGKDLQNQLDTIRRSATQNSDTDLIISYMTAKSEMDQRFFFWYTIMEDGSMVTDGDRAMGKAISLVMPSAVHRLCSWHLERNMQTNVGDSGFTQAFTHCMLTYMTESEFETQWLKAIETFGVQQNEWVKLMYCKRKL
ncbi:hypothetical protein LWI29_004637 [Acer saccharum]|uniref:MULE transposase domain-containing protein n=1 Tax=Acer saccharum TaxID=4024 RepID=A0AA39S0C1_ACESA|nr:hypothetical protein LWI29_004637 [Acer saccharum]